MSTSKNDKAETDPAKTKYGFQIVVIGLLVVLVVFLAAIVRWNTASEVATAVGSVTTVIGTLVGAFFGIKEGEAGRDKADQQRARATEAAIRLAGEVENSEKVKAVLDSLR